MSGGEFVERLDYFTTPGYVDGGRSRYDAGMPEGSGPSVLITTKGVFKFHEETKEMYLAGIHPGVTVEEIRAQVPWDLNIGDAPEVTSLPSEEEVRIIRDFAPDISAGRSLYVELLTRTVLDTLSKAAEATPETKP
jgi:glutaconate CoA-transferase subunit B